MKNRKGVALGEFFGGMALVILGLILITMNTTVSFTWYSFMIVGRAFSGGLLLIPLFIGIGMIVVMDNNWPGLIVTVLSAASLLIMLILSVHIFFRMMSLFSLILIFLPLVIGAGLVIKSLVDAGKKHKD